MTTPKSGSVTFTNPRKQTEPQVTAIRIQSADSGNPRMVANVDTLGVVQLDEDEARLVAKRMLSLEYCADLMVNLEDDAEITWQDGPHVTGRPLGLNKAALNCEMCGAQDTIDLPTPYRKFSAEFLAFAHQHKHLG